MTAKCIESGFEPKTEGMWAQKQPPFKQRVIADPPRFRALKMDGTKSFTDTSDVLRIENVVGRHPARAEASS